MTTTSLLGTPTPGASDEPSVTSQGLHTCPTTGRAYPEGVARVVTGTDSHRVIWTWCCWCDAGDGGMQPHPWEVRDA